MKRMYALVALCGLIMLCCLSSCTPVAESVKEPTAIETAVKKPLFLGDKHGGANIECGSCHQEDPPETGIPRRCGCRWERGGQDPEIDPI